MSNLIKSISGMRNKFAAWQPVNGNEPLDRKVHSIFATEVMYSPLVRPSFLLSTVKNLKGKRFASLGSKDGKIEWNVLSGKLGKQVVAVSVTTDHESNRSGNFLLLVPESVFEKSPKRLEGIRVAATVMKVAYTLPGITLTDGGLVSAKDFIEGDLVGLSGHLVGNQIFDNAGTGLVAHIDEGANRIWVHVHQDENDSLSCPKRFRPEDLFLMARDKGKSGDAYYDFPSTYESMDANDVGLQPRSDIDRIQRVQMKEDRDRLLGIITASNSEKAREGRLLGGLFRS